MYYVGVFVDLIQLFAGLYGFVCFGVWFGLICNLSLIVGIFIFL